MKLNSFSFVFFGISFCLVGLLLTIKHEVFVELLVIEHRYNFLIMSVALPIYPTSTRFGAKETINLLLLKSDILFGFYHGHTLTS